MMSTTAGQLALFEFEALLDVAYPDDFRGVKQHGLADDLADHRRLPSVEEDPGARLLRELVRRGLQRRALVPAAALVDALELEARERRKAEAA